MHSAIAVPDSASTILRHLFYQDLAGERDVVEKFHAVADGDIGCWPATQSSLTRTPASKAVARLARL